MDKVTLQYGSGTLKLEKSADWIAIKPTPGASEESIVALAANEATSIDAETLGGFRLIRLAPKVAMEPTLEALRAAAPVNVGTHVYHTSDDGVPFVPTGEIYIECKETTTDEQCQDLLDGLHLQILEGRGDRGLIVRVTSRSENPIKTALALQQSGLVDVAEPDLATPGKLQMFVIPSDPRIVDQWHLRNVGKHYGKKVGFTQGADARVVAAWERAESIGSPNVIVCVIDDGFDLDHPDLKGDWKVVAKKDFTRNSADPTPDPLTEDWHGTACAGVAIGNADGTGIVGAAPRTRLMPVRWGRSLAEKEIENWFGYAREQGAWVVSCSWGAQAKNFPLSKRRTRAIERCAHEGRNGLGTVICFAAGNESRSVNDPGNDVVNGFAIHPDVIAVAASTSRDRQSDYSNFGKEIFLCAPSSGSGGWGITTSDVMGQYTRGSETFEKGYSVGAYTDDFGGTSSACPLVAGVCALILSLAPDMRADDVKRILRDTARKIGAAAEYDADGHSVKFGYGCVDAEAAVDALLAEKADELWGTKGHGINNKVAIGGVPAPLHAFYKRYEKFIEQHAMDADHAKNQDPAERPRHFIDFDDYGAPPFEELPESYEKAVKKFGEKVVTERGLVPWIITERYDELVAAFKAEDADEVLRLSAWLGHYVGDIHVPLHTTSNHNGQKTGQPGLHSHFETSVVKKAKETDVQVEAAKAVDRSTLQADVFSWARESYSFLDAILEADAKTGGKQKKRNLAAFAVTAKPIAINRLSRGCSRLASLWFGAWTDAGKPDVSGW